MQSNNSSSATPSITGSGTLSDSVSLEALFDLCRDTLTAIRTMDKRLGQVEDKASKLTSTVKELNDCVKKFCKQSFTVKGSQYEVSLCAYVSDQLLISSIGMC